MRRVAQPHKLLILLLTLLTLLTILRMLTLFTQWHKFCKYAQNVSGRAQTFQSDTPTRFLGLWVDLHTPKTVLTARAPAVLKQKNHQMSFNIKSVIFTKY